MLKNGILNKMKDPKILLEIENLNINIETKMGQVKAIRDVSFYLNENEILGLVGESGSGKSILCKSILGILPSNAIITNGTINFKGKKLILKDKNSMSRIRGKEISMVLQNSMSSLNPSMKIGSQIVETIINNKNIDKKAAIKKSIELLQMVGIDNPKLRFKQYPHELSGGMKERVSLAIAISCEPSLLICDEITTALDTISKVELLKLLKRIQVKFNMSVIFITHDLGLVSGITDRIAVMYGGKIIEIGKVEEVLYNPKHPYTVGLIKSLPYLENKNKSLYSIPGEPVNLINPPIGDCFAIRNIHALKIDYEKEPPNMKISKTHFVRSWSFYKEEMIKNR